MWVCCAFIASIVGAALPTPHARMGHGVLPGDEGAASRACAENHTSGMGVALGFLLGALPTQTPNFSKRNPIFERID